MASKTKPKTKPSAKAIKNFSKLIGLDLVAKVKAELAAGMDPDVQFDIGYGLAPALMFAVNVSAGSARALVAAGADVTAKSKTGDTALHDVDDVKLAAELIARGADVNAVSKHKRTPLHEAATHERMAVLALLIDKGAKLDAVDAEGMTAYAAASNAAVRAVLKKHGAKGFGPGGGKVLKPKRTAAKRKDVDAERGAIGVDREGRLWVGGYQGLFLVDGDTVTRWKFTESFAIDGIAPGPAGVVYFATNWGLLQYAKDTFTLYSSNNSELFDSHLTYLRTNAAGHAYLIAYEGEADEKHVTVFDGKKFTLLRPGHELPKKITELETLAFDAKGGLILGYEHGFAFQRGGKWTVKKVDKVYDIAVTDDAWWLGTPRGLVEVRGDKLVKHETPTLAKCVCVDGNTVWFGMYYEGLGRLEAGKVTVIREDGTELPDDDVENLVRAPDGTIWVHAGGKLAVLRDGVVESFAKAKPKAKAAKPAKAKKLVAFPAKPLLAASKLPADVAAAIAATTLAGITHDDLRKIVRPAIAFDVTKPKPAVGASKFGGRPDLPASLAWPAYFDDDDRMLPFILQINLADAHAFDLEGLLPDRGMLYLFSDTAPDELSDARVLYTAETELARREFPEDLVDRKAEVDFVAQLPELGLALSQAFTLPSLELLRRRAALTDADETALQQLRETLAPDGSRLLGWPDSVQSEVVDDEHEISLVQLDGHGLSDKKANRVFDHWCSDGLIHAIIRGKALAKRKFDEVDVEMAYT